MCIIGIRPSKWGKKTEGKSEASKKRAPLPLGPVGADCRVFKELPSHPRSSLLPIRKGARAQEDRFHNKGALPLSVAHFGVHSCCLLALPSDKNLTRLAFITSPYIPPLHIYTHRPRARQPSPPLLLRLLLLHRYPPYSSLLLFVLTQHNERSSPEHPKPPNSRRLVFGESATRAEAV